MCRWLLILVLSVVSTTVAWAQSTPSTPSTPGSAVTARAQQTVVSVEQRVAQLGAQRSTLNQKLAAETDKGDQLKREKASWRRDRELREAQAEALETAKQLETISVGRTASQSIGSKVTSNRMQTARNT